MSMRRSLSSRKADRDGIMCCDGCGEIVDVLCGRDMPRFCIRWAYFYESDASSSPPPPPPDPPVPLLLTPFSHSLLSLLPGHIARNKRAAPRHRWFASPGACV